MASLADVVEALAAALEPIRDTIDDVQIYPYYLINPTPPAVDIYPGDPFQQGGAFGLDAECFFTVRARASTADSDAGQQLLLQLLDADGPASVEAALTADQTLGGVVDSVAVGEAAGTPGVTGYREYVEDAAVNGRLLGCEWRVRVLT